MPVVGRKSKLTPEVQALILAALRTGATHRMACEYAGIVQETFYTWLEKGRAGRAPYAEFLEQVTRTQGRTAVGWLEKIEAIGASGDWRALAWKLERRYPQEFTPTAKLEHTGKVEHIHTHELRVLFAQLEEEEAVERTALPAWSPPGLAALDMRQQASGAWDMDDGGEEDTDE